MGYGDMESEMDIWGELRGCFLLVNCPLLPALLVIFRPAWRKVGASVSVSPFFPNSARFHHWGCL